MNKCLQCTALIARADTSPQQQSRAKTKLGQTIHVHNMNKCLQCTALIASADTSPQQQSRATTRLGQTIHSMNKCLQCTALIASADTSPRQQSRAKTKLAESLQITYLVAFTMIGNHGSLPAKARSQMRAKQQKLQM